MSPNTIGVTLTGGTNAYMQISTCFNFLACDAVLGDCPANAAGFEEKRKSANNELDRAIVYSD
jgi:hypothetical protein